VSRNISRCLSITIVAVPLALAACKRSDTEAPPPVPPPTAPAATAPAEAPAETPAPEPFRVVGIEVGNAIGPDKRVTEPSATLSANDPTIYASVATDGSAERVTLTARWTDEDGQVLDETSREIAPTGPTVSEFHIERDDAWPTGQYQVEILSDGRSLGTSKFEVR